MTETRTTPRPTDARLKAIAAQLTSMEKAGHAEQELYFEASGLVRKLRKEDRMRLQALLNRRQ